MTPLRLLALAPFPPRLDATHGGSRAIAELLAGLGERHRVALLALQGTEEPAVDDALRARCAMVREVPRPSREAGGLRGDLRVAGALALGTPMWVSRWRVPAFHAAVRDVVRDWRPDVVQAEYHVMAQYLGAVPAGVPRVLRQLEPGAATAGERGLHRRGPGRLISRLDRRAWMRYEARVMRGADSVVALTPNDRERLAPLAGHARVTVIPLGVPIAAPADPAGRCEGTVLFVGNFIHPPNLDAAERLVGAIFPLVRAAVPSAELRVVGPGPSAALRGAAGPGVTITGEVQSVRPHLEDASVVVAPLRLGGGMRVKVAEALAAGKAVVATRLAAEGLEVESGDQLLLADEDRALADAIILLLRDPARRIAMARRAHQWAAESLGWDGPVRRFEALYASLLAAR